MLNKFRCCNASPTKNNKTYSANKKKGRINCHQQIVKKLDYEQSLFFLGPSSKTRDMQMATRVTDGERREKHEKRESLFFLLRLPPSFCASRGFAPPPACIALTKSEEKERLLAVYKETQTELSLSKSTLSLPFPLLMIFFVLAMLQLSEEIRCFRVKDIKKLFMAI